MGKFLISSLILAFIGLGISSPEAMAVKVQSPSCDVVVDAYLEKGVPFYTVSYKGHTIINPSRLGLKLKDEPDFMDCFSIMSANQTSHAETWQPVWGEESQIDNNYNELRLTLSQKRLAKDRIIDLSLIHI